MTARRSLTRLQRAAIDALIESVVEMEHYNDVPENRADPIWQAIRRRGAIALRMAKEAGIDK